MATRMTAAQRQRFESFKAGERRTAPARASARSSLRMPPNTRTKYMAAGSPGRMTTTGSLYRGKGSGRVEAVPMSASRASSRFINDYVKGLSLGGRRAEAFLRSNASGRNTMTGVRNLPSTTHNRFQKVLGNPNLRNFGRSAAIVGAAYGASSVIAKANARNGRPGRLKAGSRVRYRTPKATMRRQTRKTITNVNRNRKLTNAKASSPMRSGVPGAGRGHRATGRGPTIRRKRAARVRRDSRGRWAGSY